MACYIRSLYAAKLPMGCRAFYRRRRAGGDLHYQAFCAPRQNRLVG